ncbi:MAG TPA: hypothetical protein VGM27_09415 [Acidobacteriaceae bacterium]
MKAVLTDCSIIAVERRIRFGLGQQTGRHRHTCPIFGYIIEGTANLQVERRPEQMLAAARPYLSWRKP